MIKKTILILFIFFLFFNFGLSKEENKEDKINQMLLKKDPKIALKWAFIPGCGQFYNEKYLKGIIAITLETMAFSKSIYWEKERKKAFLNNEMFLSNNAETKRNFFYATSFWIWLYFVMDAYVDANFSFQEFLKSENNKIIFQLSENF
ncbi:MAG: hypothetical protein ABIB46_05425 [bacterium]